MTRKNSIDMNLHITVWLISQNNSWWTALRPSTTMDVTGESRSFVSFWDALFAQPPSQWDNHFPFIYCSGLPSQAFEYIMYNKGLMTETDYPYKAYVTKAKSHPSLENVSEALTLCLFTFFFYPLRKTNVSTNQSWQLLLSRMWWT